MDENDFLQLVSPAESIGDREEPEQGIALCLSGGGYRAMLYHVGALLRLNEFGLLGQLNRISSVSGGSITAGVLALQWKHLVFVDGVATNLPSLLVPAIQHMAEQSIDFAAVGWGMLNPFKSVAETVAGYYDRHLFRGATLQSLPDEPRFVFNTTNVKTGSLVRFSKPYIADYRVGIIRNSQLPISLVVAASSAFPPFLSPMEMNFSADQFEPNDGTFDLASPEYQERFVLTDGGVYDNLGLETAWKRYTNVLVSDGGRKMALNALPNTDWPSHSRRLIDLLQHQISNLRRRQVVESLNRKVRGGAYWGIQSDLHSFDSPNTLKLSPNELMLAQSETRLTAIPYVEQVGIMKLGYATCDAAMRSPRLHFLGNIHLRASEPKFDIASIQ